MTPDPYVRSPRRSPSELKSRGQTVGVAELSSGGLISAALLAVPGASAYFLGGGVIYTAKARMALLGLRREDVAGMRSPASPTPCCWPGRFARTSGRTGACRRPARRVRPATATATRPATPASPSPGRRRWRSRWRRAAPIAPANMEAFAKAALELLGSALG